MGPAIYTIVIYVIVGGFRKLLVVLIVIGHLSRMWAHLYFNIDLSTIIGHLMFSRRQNFGIFDTRRRKNMQWWCVRALMIQL